MALHPHSECTTALAAVRWHRHAESLRHLRLLTVDGACGIASFALTLRFKNGRIVTATGKASGRQAARIGLQPKSRQSSRNAARKGSDQAAEASTTGPAPLPAVLHGLSERRDFGCTGEGIVWAVIDSGIDGQHGHFLRHQNLSIGYHRDFTAHDIDESLSELEALVDRMWHGTHSAGIIAGELRATKRLPVQVELNRVGADGSRIDRHDLPAVSGVAPKCKLVSLRVLDDKGSGYVSSVIAALQWIRTVNERAGRLLIHGVNLGVGYDFEADQFSCGYSPVCVEANRLVQSGVVVVTAAGNAGYGTVAAMAGPKQVGIPYSITDPGNAEFVITVGSAHSAHSQERGVSYFSSKGPTIDGRAKPDLVAPGEGLISCVPAAARIAGRRRLRIARYADYTGTAQAAAYVSGSIAALLSARPALIGQPLAVKRLLMETAMDLKRDRFTQGSGFLDLAKALAVSADAEQLALISNGPKSSPEAGMAADAIGSSRPTGREGANAPSVPPAGKRFAVSFSYAGEDRGYVKKVLSELRRTLDRSQIFYDRYYEAELASPNMDLKLQNIYKDDSELVAVFLSVHYSSKEWTGLEWRSLREIIKQRRDEDVVLLRFDDTEVPGLLSIDGYVDLRRRDPESVADLILDRLSFNRKKAGAAMRDDRLVR